MTAGVGALVSRRAMGLASKLTEYDAYGPAVPLASSALIVLSHLLVILSLTDISG